VKKKLTFEDATMGYNKWVSGIAAREFSAQKTKFEDLFGTNKNVDQSPNNAKADNVLPYELTQAAPILADLIEKTTYTIQSFEKVKEADSVKKSKKATAEVEDIILHLKKSYRQLEAIIHRVTQEGS